MAFENNGYYQGMAGNGMQRGMPSQNMGYAQNNGMMQNGGINYTSVRPNMEQPQKTFIPGRMISQESDVIPGEVPMDGNYATFITQDMKQIYMKTWGNNGTIHTEVFANVTDQLSNNIAQPQMDAMAAIMERLDTIEKYLKKPPYRSKKPYNKNNAQNDKED